MVLAGCFGWWVFPCVAVARRSWRAGKLVGALHRVSVFLFRVCVGRSWRDGAWAWAFGVTVDATMRLSVAVGQRQRLQGRKTPMCPSGVFGA
jgi:hypothetical protein